MFTPRFFFFVHNVSEVFVTCQENYYHSEAIISNRCLGTELHAYTTETRIFLLELQPDVYLLYLMCICCILCVFVVSYEYLLYCVYCCSYFRCRTAG